MERIKQLSSGREENNFGKRNDIHLPTVRGELHLFVEETNDHGEYPRGVPSHQ
jgi:hypothetical protein